MLNYTERAYNGLVKLDQYYFFIIWSDSILFNSDRNYLIQTGHVLTRSDFNKLSEYLIIILYIIM